MMTRMMTIRIVYCVGDDAGQEQNHYNHEYDEHENVFKIQIEHENEKRRR